MNAEQEKQIQGIVLDYLSERFTREEFLFDPIRIVPGFDHYDEPIVNIVVVFDGDQDNLKPERTYGMIRHTIDRMAEIGVEDFPILRFIEKSDWERIKHKVRYAPA